MGIADVWDDEGHVDVVHNEWAAGTQRVVARLTLRDGQIQIDEPHPANWGARLLLGYSLPDGTTADPVDDPIRFLTGLHLHLGGDYLLATEPHLAADCPFAADILVMSPTPVPPAADHATHRESRSMGRRSGAGELHAG
jgi:hypothetical protein